MSDFLRLVVTFDLPLVHSLIGSIEAVFLLVIHRVFDTMGWAGVVFLMAVESAAIPFPSELIMPLAGWLLVEEKGGARLPVTE